jgi:hypothetical protein
MTKRTIFYKKEGRKYVPVYEYDQELLDAFPKGTHLVDVYPGGSSRRFNINPAYAPMIAAGRVAEDAISKAVVKASEMRPRKAPITEKQKKAWENLAKAFGDEVYYVELPSAREIAEAGTKAMQEEAEKLLKNPAVRKSYDHFLLVCQLTKETNEVQPR